MTRLVADSHLSRHFVTARLRLQLQFPILTWRIGWAAGIACPSDPVLPPALREHQLILIGFDGGRWRCTRRLTKEARVTPASSSSPQCCPDGLRQAGPAARRILKEAQHRDWNDLIVYLPLTRKPPRSLTPNAAAQPSRNQTAGCTIQDFQHLN